MSMTFVSVMEKLGQLPTRRATSELLPSVDICIATLQSFFDKYGEESSSYNIPCVDVLLTLMYEQMFLLNQPTSDLKTALRSPDTDKRQYAAVIDALWEHKRVLIQAYHNTASKASSIEELENSINEHPCTTFANLYKNLIAKQRAIDQRTTTLYTLEHDLIFANPRIFSDPDTHVLLLRQLMEHRLSFSIDIATAENADQKDQPIEQYSKQISNLVYGLECTLPDMACSVSTKKHLRSLIKMIRANRHDLSDENGTIKNLFEKEKLEVDLSDMIMIQASLQRLADLQAKLLDPNNSIGTNIDQSTKDLLSRQISILYYALMGDAFKNRLLLTTKAGDNDNFLTMYADYISNVIGHALQGQQYHDAAKINAIISHPCYSQLTEKTWSATASVILNGMLIGATVATALVAIALILYYTPATSELMMMGGNWFAHHVFGFGANWAHSGGCDIGMLAAGVAVGAATGGVAKLTCHKYQEKNATVKPHLNIQVNAYKEIMKTVQSVPA